ncbi:TPA: hypothetical protein DIC20_00755, partial [Candidatus Dependentiae bacterium]|nr:hypothetical protein [Candidatus Dependentiae bacterium]HCU00216.1 hypothetical protein [Candidatus Dependentiae bacterium]
MKRLFLLISLLMVSSLLQADTRKAVEESDFAADTVRAIFNDLSNEKVGDVVKYELIKRSSAVYYQKRAEELCEGDIVKNFADLYNAVENLGKLAGDEKLSETFVAKLNDALKEKNVSVDLSKVLAYSNSLKKPVTRGLRPAQNPVDDPRLQVIMGTVARETIRQVLNYGTTMNVNNLNVSGDQAIAGNLVVPTATITTLVTSSSLTNYDNLGVAGVLTVQGVSTFTGNITGHGTATLTHVAVPGTLTATNALA